MELICSTIVNAPFIIPVHRTRYVVYVVCAHTLLGEDIKNNKRKEERKRVWSEYSAKLTYFYLFAAARYKTPFFL